MVEKRFDIFTVDNYKKVIGRMSELIKEDKLYEIEKEFGKPTNAIWESSNNFINGEFAEDIELDVIHMYNDYCEHDAFLYLYGDIDKEGVEVSYLVRNDEDDDIFHVGIFTNVEDLVNQLNKEYNALVYLDNLFTKVEALSNTYIDDEIEEQLGYLSRYHKREINGEYLYFNLSMLLDAYLSNSVSRNSVIEDTKKLLSRLDVMVKNLELAK